MGLTEDLLDWFALARKIMAVKLSDSEEQYSYLANVISRCLILLKWPADS